MKPYGIRRDDNDIDEHADKTSITSRHGAVNTASKRAFRRIAKRRARTEGKALTNHCE